MKDRRQKPASITVGMPLPVQNPTVKGDFEPTVMLKTGVVIGAPDDKQAK